MNDFTKDELWSLIALINDTNSESIKWTHPVYKKLQTLIDNYCEHEDILTTIKFYIKDDLVDYAGKLLIPDLIDKISDKIFNDIKGMIDE